MRNYKTKLKKNDLIIVNSGKEKGKTGRILRIDIQKSRVYVEGINMVKKAIRKKNQNDRGGIIEIEGSLHLSNIQLATKGGELTRIRYEINGDKKKRISTKTGETI